MRLIDWQLRFAEFVAERSRMPFSWGKNDCCLFTADAVLAMTGVDYGLPFRGYTTALQAERLLKEHGGVRKIAISAWGDELSPLMAGVGDVVLLSNEGREALGICNGTNAFGAGPDGIAVVGMGSALAAWKV